MACIPISFPPSSPMPKLEPSAAPRPSHAPSWQLPNLGNHPTYRPSTNGVQKRKQTFQLPHRPKGSVAHLAANEQIAHLRQSRKAIKSKLYSRISRLQQELDVLQQEYYADPSDDSTSLARAPRFWPSDHAAKPRDLFAHDLEDLHRCNYSPATRPRRMVRFDAPQDEILIYTSASCLNQHTSSGPRSAASACIFKVTGLPLDESRSLAFRLENKGPTGQEHPQEANCAHLRAAIAALQNRPWREEGWSAVTIASDSEYVVEGITNWIEVWQENGWHTSRDTMNIYEGGSVANRDLWELLLSAIVEHKQNGVEIKFWLILHELNAEAHAEARTAAELLKEEEDFYPFPHNLIKVQPGFGPEEVRINSRTSGLRRFD